MTIEVKIFNNLTRQKEVFTPVKKGHVGFYSCGPTTYDFVHVGNGRALIIGDVIHRIFRALGYNVTFVRNFTDVDDKIIERANGRNIDPLLHAAEFVNEVLKDMTSLGMLPATHTPKVSETMPEIITMIQTLVDKRHAYVVDGEVLFHVPSFSGYGKLSKKDLDSLEHGKRVEVDEHKKHSSDFVLWKPSKAGEPSWESPWGMGRPGWHIECSAMAKKYLGDTIDIHHGGVDLMFPHHENEIAQSEAANGCPFCNYWCHHEFVNMDNEKMSKSLGNVITIRKFVETYGGEVLRQLLISVHYRSRLEWSDAAIEKAFRDVERIHKFVQSYQKAKSHNLDQSAQIEKSLIDEITQVVPLMKDELANDFNIPGALAHFFGMIRTLNRDYVDENCDFTFKKKMNQALVNLIDNNLKFVSETLGIVGNDPAVVLQRLNLARGSFLQDDSTQRMESSEIERLIKERSTARALKNWAQADQIRKTLMDAGVQIKDNPDGTISWSYK